MTQITLDFQYNLLYNNQAFIINKARWSSGQDVALSRLNQGFDSLTGHHIGMDFAPFRFFFCKEKSVIRSVIPPFSQKSTLFSLFV